MKAKPVGKLRRRCSVLLVARDVDARELALVQDHDVVHVKCARDAIQAIRVRCEYDVILYDLEMPDVDGVRFYGFARGLAPTLTQRIVFLVGTTIGETARAFLDAVSNSRMQKPINAAGIAHVIRTVGRP